MKKPIIAVDIDEVLVPHNAPLSELHNKLFGTRHTVEDYHDNWPFLWRVDREEAERRAKIWHTSREWKERHNEPINGSLEILKHLNKHYKLVIVTGRSQKVADFTREWLEKAFPSIFHEVHFIGIWEEGRGKTKAEICEEIGVKYLIEDSLKQARACAKKGIKVLLFGDYGWNQSEKLPEGVTRVETWQMVKKFLDEKANI